MRNDAELLQIDALRALLEDWAQWQRTYRPRLGYPSRSLSCYGEPSHDFEGLCEESDNRVFAAIDAAVEDLMPAPRAAIMKRYGIAAVFRFPRCNYEEMLLAAHRELLAALPRKGVAVL